MLAFALSLSSSGVSAAPTTTKRARVAISYIARHQNDDGSIPGFSAVGSSADAVVAMAAARRGPRQIDRAIAYLKDHIDEADSIGLKAKVVMAAVAAGEDPRNFAEVDLVGDITSSETPDGRYGADTPVLHQALAMIALAAAGEEPSEAARTWLLDAQCADGGWQFDNPSGPADNESCQSGPEDFFMSETDTTAHAVIALKEFETWEPGAERDPFAFFVARRDPEKKGWGYDLTTPITSSNSTALVIEAYREHAYRNLPKGAVRALVRLQYRLCGKRAGAFAFTYEERNGKLRRTAPDVGATVGSVLGLTPRPYAEVMVTKRPPDPGRC